jgi:hypothetical protein
VALFPEKRLKPHEWFFIPNYHFCRTDHYPGIKGGTAFAVTKRIPNNHVDLPPLISVGATGVCIPIDNSEFLLSAVYKYPGRARSGADITEFRNIESKFILAGDLNDKRSFWNSAHSNPSGKKIVALFDVNEFLNLKTAMSHSLFQCGKW